MDVDGTLTDGRFTVDKYGNETKTFNVKDGMAIHLLKSKGIKTAIITGHNSKVVEQRAKQLKIDYYFVSNNKLETLKNLMEEEDCAPNNIAYIGDDLNDLEVFQYLENTGCPADAAKEIYKQSSFTCSLKGGYGAVREYAEYIISRSLNNDD